LRRVGLVADSVKVSLPNAWTKTKALPLFDPCYICGPKGILSRMICDDKEESSLAVTVTSYCREPTPPAYYEMPKSALRSYVQELLDMERGTAICLDSSTNGVMTAVGLKALRTQKPTYIKRITFVGKRNRVLYVLEGPMNIETINTFEQVQRSMVVAPGYLN
jgi:hypothetical protein